MSWRWWSRWYRSIWSVAICRIVAFHSLMIMALPFALGVVAIVLAMSGRRLVAIWAWAATVIVLLAWLGYHSTNVLAISL